MAPVCVGLLALVGVISARAAAGVTTVRRPNIPEHFDARIQWPYCPSIGRIPDQGACGSCWAVAAVTTMTDRICIATEGRVQVQLSVQQVMTCVHSELSGCNGGFPWRAWDYWHDQGIISADCQPYSIPGCTHFGTGSKPQCGPYIRDHEFIHTPRCERSCTNRTYLTDYGNEKRFRGSKLRELAEQGIEAIQRDMLEHGPVAAAMTVFEDFVNYSSGIYKHKSGNEVYGHAVKLIGWGVEDGQPYWLAVNSWNNEWGDHGFFKIVRGTNDSAIESDVLSAVPILNGATVQVPHAVLFLYLCTMCAAYIRSRTYS